MSSRRFVLLLLTTAVVAGCGSPTSAENPRQLNGGAAHANGETTATADTTGRGGNVMGGGH